MYLSLWHWDLPRDLSIYFLPSFCQWIGASHLKCKCKAHADSAVWEKSKWPLWYQKVPSKAWLNVITPPFDLIPPIFALNLLGKCLNENLPLKSGPTSHWPGTVRQEVPWHLAFEERKDGQVVVCMCVCVFHVFWNVRCVSRCQPACQKQAAPVHNRGSSLHWVTLTMSSSAEVSGQ